MTNTCKCGHEDYLHRINIEECTHRLRFTHKRCPCTKFEPMNDEFAEAINNPDFIAKAIKDSNQAQIDLVARANETKTESVEEKQKQFPSYWQRELEIDYIHAAWLVGEFRTEISKAEQRGREEGYKDGYIDGEKAGHIDKKWDIVMNIAKNALKGDEPK